MLGSSPGYLVGRQIPAVSACSTSKPARRTKVLMVALLKW
jgi:hypothetical protein